MGCRSVINTKNENKKNSNQNEETMPTLNIITNGANYKLTAIC